MRAVVAFAVLTLSILVSPPVASAEAAALESNVAPHRIDTVVFVGRLLSILEVPREILLRDCMRDPEAICLPPRDSVYEARYQVLHAVSGRIDVPEVRFTIVSHYGFPPFALHSEAVLFVGHRDGEYWLHKYQGFAVHRTVDDGWAHCGDFLYRYVGESAPAELRPLSFSEDFGPAKQLARDDPRRKFPDGSFVAENDRIVCPRGIALNDLYELVRNGVMKARGYALPPMREATTTR